MTDHPQAVRASEARLNSVEALQERLDLGRSQVFELLAAEQAVPGTGIRSVRVGRRRLIPESAIVEYIERLEAGGAA